MQTPIAEPAAFSRQFFQAHAKRTVIKVPRPIAVDLGRKANQSAVTPLRLVLLFNSPAHGKRFRGGREKFFLSVNFKVALSMTSSASDFLSLRFSTFNAFKRSASETSRPPS
jgi:hypothetical protein